MTLLIQVQGKQHKFDWHKEACYVCPTCEYLFCNRKKKGCPKCGTKLYLRGDYFAADEDCFIWNKDKGWVHI